MASFRTVMTPILASARTVAETLEIVAPLSIRTSPVLGSTTSPQAIRPSRRAADPSLLVSMSSES